MRIRLTGFEGQAKLDTAADVWASFTSTLEDLGLQVAEGQFGEAVEGLIAFNHSRSALKEAISQGVPRHKRALVLWEPKVVRPDQYSKRTLSQYGFVYSPSPQRRVIPGTRVFPWISRKSETCFVPAEAQLNRCYMVNANKFSFVSSEQYTLRQLVVKECRKRDVAFDLWGFDWNAARMWKAKRLLLALHSCVRAGCLPRPTSLRGISTKALVSNGAIEDKISLGRNYRIGLVIENQLDYVSEKMFDVADAGSVVVYAGPRLVDFGLQGCAVEVEASKNRVVDVVQELLSKSPEELESLRAAQTAALARVRENGDLGSAVYSLARLMADDLKGRNEG